jgi:hypothetical protein
MKVLSVRQPWAWALIHAGKDIENRTWPTKYRGPVAIHASKGMTRKEFDAAKYYMLEIGVPRVPNPDELEFGQIIGIVDIVDLVSEEELPISEWFEGPWGWVVQNPRQVKPVPMKGMLGLRDYDKELILI